jgi:hypothetical protein
MAIPPGLLLSGMAWPLSKSIVNITCSLFAILVFTFPEVPMYIGVGIDWQAAGCVSYRSHGKTGCYRHCGTSLCEKFCPESRSEISLGFWAWSGLPAFIAA